MGLKIPILKIRMSSWGVGLIRYILHVYMLMLCYLLTMKLFLCNYNLHRYSITLAWANTY